LRMEVNIIDPENPEGAPGKVYFEIKNPLDPEEDFRRFCYEELLLTENQCRIFKDSIDVDEIRRDFES
jgi:hypothetical protein